MSFCGMMTWAWAIGYFRALKDRGLCFSGLRSKAKRNEFLNMNHPQPDSRMGFILAGGRSSRMGSDKALLEFQGKTLIERAVELMRRSSLDFAIVGDPAKYSAHGQVVPDVHANCGPLAGIHAALRQSRAELNLML